MGGVESSHGKPPRNGHDGVTEAAEDPRSPPMNRRDRKQQKKKQRKERLRKEKHLRQEPAGRVRENALQPAKQHFTAQPEGAGATNPEETVTVNIFATEDAQRWL